MRLALALCATLACAQAAAAQTVEDRYGPARPRAHAAAQQVASLTPYEGRLLSWSSKAAAPAPTLVEPVAAPQPAPVRAPLAQLPAAAPAPHPQPVAISAAPAAAPRPERAPPAAARRPDSLYAPPPPEAAPAPQRMAAAAPPAAAAPVGSRTHYYSVHREYGLAPDAIPAPSQANRYVLIGPPDGAAEDRRKDDDAEDRPF